MTYLELCQKTLEAAGTGRESEIASFTALSAYQRQIISYVDEAWRFIQTIHDRWGWREHEFIAELQPQVDSYSWDRLHQTGSTTEAPRYSIHRRLGWRRWYHRAPGDYTEGPQWIVSAPAGEDPSYSVLLPADFEVIRMRRLVNPGNTRPGIFAIAPDKRIIVHPSPDRRYQIQGMFIEGVQLMTSPEHVPRGLPNEYHIMIKWRAVMMAQANDEASLSYDFARDNYRELLTSLERYYLPEIEFSGPVA